LAIEWIFALSALLEGGLGCRFKICHPSKKYLVEVAEPDIHRAELLL
jgi:hypothetical protein